MLQTAPDTADLRAQLEPLAELAADAIGKARAAGADQAALSLSVEAGLSVNVRKGEVDTLEYTRDRGLSLTVYMQGRKGSASTADLSADSINKTLDHALAIARYTEADPAAGLADEDRLATEFPDLDLWHPQPLDAEAAIVQATACEAAALEFDPRISNTEGASSNLGQGIAIYANSYGFLGREASTRCSLSASVIAGSEDAMQRDYYYDSARAAADLRDAAEIGQEAARRTLARIGPKPIKTGEYPVIFTPEISRGFFAHLCSAASGGSLYRRASFLLDACGKQVLPDWLQAVEDPFMLRGTGSCSFDAEGVATKRQALVENGVLRRYLLGSYSARKLGLESTGNAGGMHNLLINSNAGDLQSLISTIKRGLLVTEVMGQGVNLITGDYSRGASGVWIENGEIAHPVHEITIAGHLPTLYRSIEAIGSDTDTRGNVRCGSIMVGKMTVAAES